MPGKSFLPASLTIPNLITLVRILLTPVFIIFLIRGSYRKALIIFVLAGISDLADGLVARHWQQKTRLGTFLDPLADKLLISSSFLTLGILRLIPSWLTVVVFSRDIALGLGVLVLKLADYPLEIKPTRTGKWTTTLQLLTVFLVVVGKSVSLPLVVLKGCYWLTGGITAISGIQYMYVGLRRAGSVAGNRRQGNNRG